MPEHDTILPEDRPEDGGSDPRETLAPELRARLVERDPDALRAFFDAYFDRIYGYVRRLVGSEHLAEDLTQDIFMHLHQAFPKYDPERDLRPWVFTIATNKIRDHWRSRRHRDSQREHTIDRDEDEGPWELPAGTARPEELLTEDELAQGLREAVEALPEGLRMTVLLRVYEELSFEAIGRILDRNEVAVRKRYSRALDALRAALAKQLPEGA